MTENLRSNNEKRRAVLEEMLAREEARKSLSCFTSYTKDDYIRAKHNELICAEFDKVIAGETKRLMILCPPRHGKSELASVRFPARYLGEHPDRQVIQVSYGASLAEHFSGQVRELVESSAYQRLYPGMELRQDSRAKALWQTKQGGIYVAAGMGGAVTGFGGHLITLDDPIKNREEADSEAFRDSAWNFYTSTLYTRRMPGCAIVVVLTPWHEDDIHGRILAQAKEDGTPWRVVRMPAFCDAPDEDPLARAIGEPLWPERYDGKELSDIRLAIGERDWQSLYQCQPLPEGGAFFKREWFDFYEEPPRGVRYWISSDWAVSEDDSSDYTVHQVWAAKGSELYLADQYRGQVPTDQGIDAALDFVGIYKPMGWINEKGQINKAVRPFLIKRMRERGTHCRLFDYARTRDKATTARALQAIMSIGDVKFPKGQPWMPELKAEFLKFPRGKHDDQVDAAAGMAQHLEKIIRPNKHRQTVYRNTGGRDFDPLGQGSTSSSYLN